MEHGKYVGVRGEPRRDGVYVLRKPLKLEPTPYRVILDTGIFDFKAVSPHATVFEI
jgi:hypothetical protein